MRVGRKIGPSRQVSRVAHRDLYLAVRQILESKESSFLERPAKQKAE